MQNAAPAAQITVTDIACRRGDRVLFSGLSWQAGPGTDERLE